MVFIGFVVGAITMSLYGMSGDAMMHCFLLDEELNGNPEHAPEELHNFMNTEREAKKA